MTVSSFAKMFGSVSKEEKCKPTPSRRSECDRKGGRLLMNVARLVIEQYHASGASAKHPDGSSAPSAHISAHPAVRTIENKARQARTRKLRIPFRNRVDEFHDKARKRADKAPLKSGGGKGAAAAPKRMGPRGEDAVPFWGVKVPLAGPWASATAATTTAAIYAMPPGEVNTGPGSVGSCASGTCGGSGGCGSETLGMCTAGCTGVSNPLPPELLVLLLLLRESSIANIQGARRSLVGSGALPDAVDMLIRAEWRLRWRAVIYLAVCRSDRNPGPSWLSVLGQGDIHGPTEASP